MSQWNQCRLIDIFTNIDMEMLESDGVEADLENVELVEKVKERWSKKKIALITSIAAGGCAVITGAVVLLCKKSLWMKKAA